MPIKIMLQYKKNKPADTGLFMVIFSVVNIAENRLSSKGIPQRQTQFLHYSFGGYAAKKHWHTPKTDVPVYQITDQVLL